MEQVTVKELASEFELKNTVVISELKKIGVWVPSAETPVDTDIAERIRKRLQMMVETEQEEKEKKTEKARRSSGSRVRRSIKELGKPRRRAAASKREKPEEEETPQSPLATGSLKPRKGRKAAYRKEPEPVSEETPRRTEVTIDDEPLIEKVEAKAPIEFKPQEVSPEELKQETPPETAETAPAETAEVAQPRKKKEKAPLAPEEPEAAPTEPEEAPVSATEAAAEPSAAEETPEEVPAQEVAEAAEPTEKPAAEVSGKVEPRRKKRRKEKAKPSRKPARGEPEVIGPREIFFSERVTVKSLAEKLNVKSAEVIRHLMSLGVMANMNQVLEQSVVEKICENFEVIPNFVTFEEAEAQQQQPEDRAEDLVDRAPVVTIMGHVDHGKTTLLDHIRKTRVAEGEAGGITQHIGAYKVEQKGQNIVFIDTPGHEAFTRMRARGAQATDIVVLVVAADDGVMPQTQEAIDHARAANVPIVVAINKIDKPDAQPQRVKQELSEKGLIPEDWGGDTVVVEVSAIDGTNVDLLLEMILLVADLLELKANPNRPGSGVILEAKMEKGRGTVATLLVQNGTISVGDTFIAGAAYGRVRAMFDDRGETLGKAGPSSAVEVLGLQSLPQAGDVFQVVEDQARAREMVEFRQEKQRETELAKSSKVSLDDLFAQMEAGEVKELPVVLKADTLGSVEVLDDTLQKLSAQQVKINVIHRAVGAISESDVLLASASNAIVIGFNVRPEQSARAAAEHEDVEIRVYSVIYDVAKDIQQAMVGLLEPTFEEKYLGRAEVRETFKVPRYGTVAGCYVQDGIVSRNAQVRLLRDNVVVYDGRLDSLRRFKDDVNEVRAGYECGMSIANYNDIKMGDVIEAYVKEEVAPQLT